MLSKFLNFLCIFFLLVVQSLSHSNHEKLLEAKKPYPEINQFVIKKKGASEYEARIEVKNFVLSKFSSRSDLKADTNAGHFILIINNENVMYDSETFIVEDRYLKKGKNEIILVLMSDDHSMLTKNGDLIYKSFLLIK